MTTMGRVLGMGLLAMGLAAAPVGCEYYDEDDMDIDLPDAVDIEGDWTLQVGAETMTLAVGQSGNIADGTLTDGSGAEWPITGAVSENSFVFSVEEDAGLSLSAASTVSGDTVSGTLVRDEVATDFTGTRSVE